MRHIAISLSLALTTGCLFGGGQLSIHEQIQQGVTMGDNEPGKVDRTTLATGEILQVETPVFGAKPVMMRGIIDDEICYGQMLNYVDAYSREEAIASAEGYYKRARYAFHAFESLDELTASTPWPDPPATDKFEVQLADVSFEDGECDEYGEKCTMGTWHILVGFCTPIPPIPPTANYVALFIIGTKSKRIAIWELTGDPPPAAEITPPAEEPPLEDAPSE